MTLPVRVPFLDLNAAVAEHRDELDAAYHRVLDSGWFLLGTETDAFEREFAQACGVEHAVVVSTGLDALVLSLRALDVGPGDEVIVPGFTFIATWLAVTATGARPVPVDVDDVTCNLDPDLVEAAVSPRTRAIVPVHLQGRPAAMSRILEIADRHHLFVVEDAAQAHLARSGGELVGGLGHAGAFSFYPGKNLGALGDGGAVTTHDPEVAERLRMLRNYGSRIKYVHDVPGVNSRLDELQCAFLRARLRALARWNDRRREIAGHYLTRLADCDLRLPAQEADIDHVWHVFAIRVADRTRVADQLAACGVQTLIHYPTAPHQTGAYAEFAEISLPVTEAICRQTLSLPIGPHLSWEHIEHVVASVRAVTT